MFCEKCGAQIADNAAFCGNCGAPVAGQKVSGVLGSRPAQTRQFRKSGLIVAVAVVALVLLISTLTGNKNDQKSKGYLENVENLGEALQNADGRLLGESMWVGTAEYVTYMEMVDDDDLEDDWESISEEMAQLLEESEEEFGSSIIEIKTSVVDDNKLRGDNLYHAVMRLEGSEYIKDSIEEVVVMDVIVEIIGSKDSEKLIIEDVCAIRTRWGWSLYFDTASGDYYEYSIFACLASM